MRCLELKPAFDDLLLLDGDFARQREAALRLDAQLRELTALDRNESGNQLETVTSSGVALSPVSAAECVIDFPRTGKFALGLELAVCEAQRRFPGQCIEIVYAGCGPFALLAIPLTQRFTPSEIQFTMLDLHARSLELARELFAKLEITEYVREWVQCDAVTYRHPGDRSFHVLVSETMRKALASEPQVAITLNLAPQLTTGGILVPERISIGAAVDEVTDAEWIHSGDLRAAPELGRRPNMAELGTVFELSANTPPPDAKGMFPPVTITIPDGPARTLVLTTRIHTFGDIVLDDYESGLTYPTVLKQLGLLESDWQVEIQYGLGIEPGFRYRILHA